MTKVIKLKRGLDINLKGKAEKFFVKSEPAKYYAVKPTDFKGLTPKLLVKEGDTVKTGTPLFYDKNRPEILFTSSATGKITAINRGERRKILEVVIEASDTSEYEEFKKGDTTSLSKEEIIENLLKSGLWPMVRQRPYNIIANPKDEPKAIYISCFDTAPLGPDLDFIVQDSAASFQYGINALSKLTKGSVNLGLNADYPASKTFKEAKNVQLHLFNGKHPAGNVGVQIHHINPLNKGEVVWVLNPQDVISIGRLFETGHYDPSKIVALTGSEILRPKYYKTTSGTSITPMIEKNTSPGKLRYISGNVLTGTQIISDGFLGYYDSQVTVIPEGDHFEFLGWAMPGINKYSNSRAFFSWLMPGKEYRLDTNYNGGERAFVMTGQYDKVLPMDVYPVHLLKAILVEDIELMEKLGIYEVVEEDFALCEFVCTSKIEVQEIISKGIDLMVKEMS